MNALLRPLEIERHIGCEIRNGYLELALAVPKPRKVETAVRNEEDEEELEGEGWKYECGLLSGRESGKRPEEEQQEFEKMIEELQSGKRSEEDKIVTLKLKLPEWRPDGRSVVFATGTRREFNRANQNETEAAQALFGYLEKVKAALATHLKRRRGVYLIHERENADTTAMRIELERHGYYKHPVEEGALRKRYPGTAEIESLTKMQKGLLDQLIKHLQATRPVQKSAGRAA